MKREKILDANKMFTRCGWNPYAGERVRGIPETTIVRGSVVMQDYGNVVGKPGYGEYVSPNLNPPSGEWDPTGLKPALAPPAS
jgi:hypothetical protein